MMDIEDLVDFVDKAPENELRGYAKTLTRLMKKTQLRQIQGMFRTKVVFDAGAGLDNETVTEQTKRKKPGRPKKEKRKEKDIDLSLPDDTDFLAYSKDPDIIDSDDIQDDVIVDDDDDDGFSFDR